MTTSEKYPTVKQVHESFQKAIENEPAYKEMLPFFQSLYEMQVAAVEATHPEEITIPPEILKARLTGEMPLIERRQVTLDQASATLLLRAMLAATKTANHQLAAAADLLKEYLDNDESPLEQCHRMFLDEDRDGLRKLCEKIGIAVEMLDFFLYNSVWPSLAHHSRRLSAEHKLNGGWHKGYCPICGALPEISFLSETGQRFLVCRFCRHQWSVKRIQCPFCDNNDSETIGYHFSDDDKARRIDTCDRCKSYIINIDTRQLPRVFYPPLEALIAAHLGIKAEQMGYQRATDLNYQELALIK